MPKLIAVIIRKLPNHRPLTSAIIESSNDPDIVDMAHYLINRGKDHIAYFCSQNVEFSSADWYIDIIDLFDNSIVKTMKVNK